MQTDIWRGESKEITSRKKIDTYKLRDILGSLSALHIIPMILNVILCFLRLKHCVNLIKNDCRSKTYLCENVRSAVAFCVAFQNIPIPWITLFIYIYLTVSAQISNKTHTFPKCISRIRFAGNYLFCPKHIWYLHTRIAVFCIRNQWWLIIYDERVCRAASHSIVYVYCVVRVTLTKYEDFFSGCTDAALKIWMSAL